MSTELQSSDSIVNNSLGAENLELEEDDNGDNDNGSDNHHPL